MIKQLLVTRTGLHKDITNMIQLQNIVTFSYGNICNWNEINNKVSEKLHVKVQNKTKILLLQTNMSGI